MLKAFYVYVPFFFSLFSSGSDFKVILHGGLWQYIPSRMEFWSWILYLFEGNNDHMAYD